MANTLYEQLSDIKKTIDKYFRAELPSASIPSTSTNNRTHHTHHHYHHPEPRIYGYFPQSLYVLPSQRSSPTVIINNPPSDEKKAKEKDEKSDEQSSTLKVLAVVAGMATSFAATYVLSKDEYIQYWQSELDDDMNRLRLCPRQEPEIIQLLVAYNKWKQMFTARTRPQTVAKAGAAVSLLTGAGGLFLASTALCLTGVGGFTVGGCFLLWKTMQGKKDREQEAFENFLKILDQLLGQEGLGETRDETRNELSGETPGDTQGQKEGHPQSDPENENDVTPSAPYE